MRKQTTACFIFFYLFGIVFSLYKRFLSKFGLLFVCFYFRQAVSKYTSRLQKYEYNNDDPPQWFGYDDDSQVQIQKKQKKTLAREKSLSNKSEDTIQLPEPKQ